MGLAVFHRCRWVSWQGLWRWIAVEVVWAVEQHQPPWQRAYRLLVVVPRVVVVKQCVMHWHPVWRWMCRQHAVGLDVVFVGVCIPKMRFKASSSSETPSTICCKAFEIGVVKSMSSRRLGNSSSRCIRCCLSCCKAKSSLSAAMSRLSWSACVVCLNSISR